MHKRFLLALTCAVIGAGLLVAAAFAGSAAPTKASKSGSADAKRGGTLRVNLSETDFEFLDPALAYDSAGWTVLFATNMTLLNYPDKPAPVGNRLTPEAAAAFPTVSRDGKTYTFTVRSGIKFSDGSALTAASFKRAIEAQPTRTRARLPSPSCTPSWALTPATRARRSRSPVSRRRARS